MTGAVARALIAMAGSCLGDHRRDWALAMEAELEAAIDDGRPVAFAFGCLTSAIRDMPMHAEGRFQLANHAIAIGMIVPIAALLVSATLLGLPLSVAGHVGIFGWVATEGGWASLVIISKQGAVPALALLAAILIVGHLLTPWYMLERDWTRVAMLARMNAAATATLMVFAGILFLGETCTLLPVVALALEAPPIMLLSRWHARLSSTASPALFTP